MMMLVCGCHGRRQQRRRLRATFPEKENSSHRLVSLQTSCMPCPSFSRKAEWLDIDLPFTTELRVLFLFSAVIFSNMRKGEGSF